jgi:DNA repair protein RecO (recombination protein O)
MEEWTGMAVVKTQGIVLRYVNYRDADRIVTLFSRELGKIQVTARGCRRQKSRLLVATELFCYGEYILYFRQGRYTMTQCEIKDDFYNIRTNLDTLAYSTYLINLCEEAIQPGEGNSYLFRLLLNALTYLSYSDLNPLDITLIFSLKMIDLLGYRPQLSACVRCGNENPDAVAFSSREGGILCRKCNNADPFAYNIHKGTLQTMKYILQMDSARMGTIRIGEETKEELKKIIKVYLSQRLEKHFKSWGFIERFDKTGRKEG